MLITNWISDVCSSVLLISSRAVVPYIQMFQAYASSDFGDLQRRVYIDRDNARHALLLHGNAHQLPGHLHGDSIVGNKQELRLLAHAADKIRIALGIGVVQRRVYFVQQTEWSGIELEQRKHQRRRRQRLLAARSEEHTSELQSLMRISYPVFC